MSAAGAFTFVLHSHLPYCRQAGTWPHGEEWIHEAAAETYIPLLNALYDLIAEGIQPKLTIGITPILTEQLADPLVLEHFVTYLQAKIAAADREVQRQAALKRGAAPPADLPQAAFNPAKGHTVTDGATDFAAEHNDSSAPVEQWSAHTLALAHWYRDWYQTTLRSFREVYHGDIIGAFKHLQNQGMIEIMTSAATHAYLPLVSRDSTMFAQIRSAVESYHRHYGCAPRTIWLPECGYRPAYRADDRLKPGVEAFLQAQGLGAFFTEAHLIEGGMPTDIGQSSLLGMYSSLLPRRVIAETSDAQPIRGTTFEPYTVYDSGVAVIGRNPQTGMQVWSATHGYPGEALYREFHKKDCLSGLSYWRITDTQANLSAKDWYDPKLAFAKTGEHAHHFTDLVVDLLRDYRRDTGKFGYIAAVYDTELFGHWWFEGIAWLKQTLRDLHRRDEVQLMTTSEFLAAHPPRDSVSLPEGSWGQGGNHSVWFNAETEWIWALIYDAERHMEELVAAYPAPTPDEVYVLNQIARELLLLESSDWPFLITTGQADEYAQQRFNEHLARFNRLRLMLRHDDRSAARAEAEHLYALDNPFPTIDYRLFAEREGQAGGH
jgi:1,4-alpha-glucan branching enzyme